MLRNKLMGSEKDTVSMGNVRFPRLALAQAVLKVSVAEKSLNEE